MSNERPVRRKGGNSSAWFATFGTAGFMAAFMVYYYDWLGDRGIAPPLREYLWMCAAVAGMTVVGIGIGWWRLMAARKASRERRKTLNI